MMRKAKYLVLSFTLFFMVSCNPALLNDISETNVENILHSFNWLGNEADDENSFEDKPFLKKNADGNNGAAGVLDINREGEPEFLMRVCDVPRGVPSVEIFSIKNNKLQSMGGFFEGRDTPYKISYYTGPDGQLLFLQETEAHYGGITNMLVATYLDDFCNVPICAVKTDYLSYSPDMYAVFPIDGIMECTNRFVVGDFDQEQYIVTKEEYECARTEFLESLTWIEDVYYEYDIQYHLYNGYELLNEIRYDEISQAAQNGDRGKFKTQEEYKKTSDMVADALYKAYKEL